MAGSELSGVTNGAKISASELPPTAQLLPGFGRRARADGFRGGRASLPNSSGWRCRKTARFSVISVVFALRTRYSLGPGIGLEQRLMRGYVPIRAGS